MVYDEINSDKKRTSTVEIVTVMVTILAAITILFNSGNLPLLWYAFSFVFLIILMLYVLISSFARPINKKIQIIRDGRKRNAISRKYASDFEDIVQKSWEFNNSIYKIFIDLRTHYENDIKSSLSMHILKSYEQEKIGKSITKIMKDIDESNKTFRDLCLINEHFESVLDTFTRNLKIIEVFAHEITITTGKPIAKGIEDDFEAFRDNYILYIKSVKDFRDKINRETGTYNFPANLELLKRW